MMNQGTLPASRVRLASPFVRILLVFIAAFAALQAKAANVATSDVTNQAQAKKWHILFDMNHSPAARADQFTTTDFTMFFDYQWEKDHLFRVLQAPTKKYDIGEGENEWTASDTIFYHFWNTGVSAGPFRVRLVSAVNLPTSEESQDNDKIATFSETLQFNAFFMKKFMVSLRPFMRYNWYEFRTTREGNLLPALVYGVNLVTSYQLSDKLSLNGTFGYNEISEFASEYEPNLNAGLFAENNSGTYFIILSANYSFTDKFGAYIGYSQGDTYIRDGRYEVNVYDPQLARYNAGLTFYF